MAQKLTQSFEVSETPKDDSDQSKPGPQRKHLLVVPGRPYKIISSNTSTCIYVLEHVKVQLRFIL